MVERVARQLGWDDAPTWEKAVLVVGLVGKEDIRRTSV